MAILVFLGSFVAYIGILFLVDKAKKKYHDHKQLHKTTD